MPSFKAEIRKEDICLLLLLPSLYQQQQQTNKSLINGRNNNFHDTHPSANFAHKCIIRSEGNGGMLKGDWGKGQGKGQGEMGRGLGI